MKLVTFSVPGPFGGQHRLGALAGAAIVDLTTAYATYLARATDEPLPGELAQLRIPPDLIGWLRGQHKAREALSKRSPGWRRRTWVRMRAASTMRGSSSTAQRSDCSPRCRGPIRSEISPSSRNT